MLLSRGAGTRLLERRDITLPSLTLSMNSRQSSAEIRLTSHSPQLGVTRDKPASSKKLRPRGIGSEACLIVGPLLIVCKRRFSILNQEGYSR